MLFDCTNISLISNFAYWCAKLHMSMQNCSLIYSLAYHVKSISHANFMYMKQKLKVEVCLFSKKEKLSTLWGTAVDILYQRSSISALQSRNGLSFFGEKSVTFFTPLSGWEHHCQLPFLVTTINRLSHSGYWKIFCFSFWHSL